MPGKILLLTHSYRSINIDEAFQAIIDNTQADLLRLDKRAIKWLPLTLWKHRVARYDTVLLDLPFKHVHQKIRTLKRIPNLVIYEEDACQDSISTSKWQGAFTRLYQAVMPTKVIVSGHITATRLKAAGINAVFVPKGFASTNSGLLEQPRDIEVGFIGRTRSTTYQERAALLDSAHQTLGCQLLRTQSPEEYKQTLNRIRFFFSADKGLDEYMAKNFEAMACGCILVAYRQGHGEEEALGLKDMENCLLYGSLEEAREKIERVKQDTALQNTIQRNSIQLSADFSHRIMGKKIAAQLTQPVTTDDQP